MNPPDRPRRGEIWWAYTPGQPDDSHQPRPVLVVSVDVRNRLADDLIVIPIFSQGRLGPTRVQIPQDFLDLVVLAVQNAITL